MSNYFLLTLDTTGPSNPTFVIEGGAAFSNDVFVNCAINTGDGTKTGYQMKIWGEVDATNEATIQPTEAESTWITYQSTKQVKLSSTDGPKTLYLKLRDDVQNESAQVSDSITLDTTKPIVTISGPDVSKVSKKSGKDVAAFSFMSDQAFAEYKVKVVSSTGAAHDTGTQISTANGSTNMFGTTGAADTSINCSINGADLETASAGDGEKIIKVFVKDSAGNWSV
ncbi:hypothetical protein [Bacillus solitudinis]|uniref:hypothetical protein n=1 Tax=Bacillus solitudinis TaxID=2014074 RepID=UPI000C23B8DC|nr:hypothetical protein [Bacillus solitudinis]